VAPAARPAPAAADEGLSVIAFGPRCDISTRVQLTGDLVIGRDPGCDLVLDDEAVSRRHAHLRLEPGALRVVDLDSRNGLRIDGEPCAEGPLALGSLVRIGGTMLRIARTAAETLSSRRPDERGPGSLVGGPSLAGLRRTISVMAPTALPVLVLGETGCGKELVSRRLHTLSKRSGPLVPVNCAALPDTLAESELFGHARGAFSGADRARDGLFAAANGGTLFLDEVGELPLAVQSKLLRVLEDGRVRPVGGVSERAVDVRIVSATNRDLEAEVARGRFRGDLLARLAGVTLRVPALRDRVEDLPMLCDFLFGRAGVDARLSPDALEAMSLYRWPYNVRELDHTLRAATVEAAGETIELEHLPAPIRGAAARSRPGADGFAAASVSPGVARKGAVFAALRDHGGNVRRASESLGLSRGHVYRLITRFDIDLDSIRRGARNSGAVGGEETAR